MGITLKNPLAPATESQLGLISRLTTQDRPRLKTNPDGWTMEQARQIIDVAFKTKKGSSVVKVNGVSPEVFSLDEIASAIMKSGKKPTEASVAMVIAKLKEK